MSIIPNLKKEIKLPIQVREYDSKRCAMECLFILKKHGQYTCIIWDEVVDHGDDDEKNDYRFIRCQQCLDSEFL